jgi:HEAT repeat protein
VPALIDALADKEEEVLKAAAQGLKRIQGKEIGERE